MTYCIMYEYKNAFSPHFIQIEINAERYHTEYIIINEVTLMSFLIFNYVQIVCMYVHSYYANVSTKTIKTSKEVLCSTVTEPFIPS